ncbi:MAG: PadR family transcriptional regulator [Rhodobacteraceae bacterium]|nr:PadR family transcriptional regulator [Paracoccaceae bacterium]
MRHHPREDAARPEGPHQHHQRHHRGPFGRGPGFGPDGGRAHGEPGCGGPEHGGPEHGGPGRGGPGFGRGGGPRKRVFDYGEIRLLILAMIESAPRHGYQIIKAIEERFNGQYAPSPGVVYPTLAWLDDMGYARSEADEGGRKRMRITDEGLAFLSANRAAAEELLTRQPPRRPHGIQPEIEAAMDTLKEALRARRGASPGSVAAIAAAIRAAADEIRRDVPGDEA